MTIDPNRVKEIFLEATDQPDEAARAAFLDRACGNDADLRQRVDALVRSHDPDDSFLGRPAVEDLQPHELATQDAANPSLAEEDLGFLEPPRRADSLGRIGHFEVLQVLGKGGFGIVLRAFDEVLQRVVAVKVLAPQLAVTSPARRRFLREARSSAAVRHENVVQVYEVGEQPLPYLAMEFIPGETLQQRLDSTGPLGVTEVLRIGQQIAEGLAAAHACDLIHRDIKPGNILLEGGTNRAKITDFGLARTADDASISQSGIIAGTPMFMAPEQALGHKVDQRADLFSLGSVLYQMASGRPPFRAPSTLAVLKRVAEEPARPIREIIAVGQKLTMKVNNVVVAETTDTTHARGQIVLFCSDKVRYKTIEIKPLPLPSAVGPDGWVQLFNGKEAHGLLLGAWQIDKKTRLLLGSGPGQTYVFTDRDDYADFHLKAEFMCGGKTDSAIYFRCGKELLNGEFPAGYQVYTGLRQNLNPNALLLTTADSPKPKLLHNPTDRAVPGGDYRPLEIIARGSRIEIKHDGKTLVDYTDDKATHRKGRIALQVSSPETGGIAFKKLEIKEFPPE